MENVKAEKLTPQDQPRVQRFLEDLLQRTKLPGMSVAVSSNDVTLEAASGISDTRTGRAMTPEVRFELGSISGLLVALVALELVSEERLDANRAVSNYLPELAGEIGDRITPAHLLTRTAGVQSENLADPDLALDYSYAALASTFNARPMLFRPGAVFDDSPSAPALLTSLIERIGGESIYEQVCRRIFEPLGIDATPWDLGSAAGGCAGRHLKGPYSEFGETPGVVDWCEFWRFAAGGAWVTAGDLVRIGSALVRKGAMLTPAAVDMLLGQAVRLPGRFTAPGAEQPFHVFGLGCARYPTGAHGVSSASQGQCCALRFDTDNGIVVAVALNASEAHIRDLALNKLFNSLLPKDPPIREEFLGHPGIDFELEESVGVYEGAQHDGFEVAIESHALIVRRRYSPVEDRDTEQPLLILSRNEGRLALGAAPLLSIGFFREPDQGELCLMAGTKAYRKVRP